MSLTVEEQILRQQRSVYCTKVSHASCGSDSGSFWWDKSVLNCNLGVSVLKLCVLKVGRLREDFLSFTMQMLFLTATDLGRAERVSCLLLMLRTLFTYSTLPFPQEQFLQQCISSAQEYLGWYHLADIGKGKKTLQFSQLACGRNCLLYTRRYMREILFLQLKCFFHLSMVKTC